MVRCVASFLGRKNIVGINSYVSCAAAVMTPLVRSLTISALTSECWWLLKTLGLPLCCMGATPFLNSSLTPVTIRRIVASVVIACHCGKKCLSSPAWKLVCDFSKLCTMSIDKDVMFALHTSDTFIGTGWFRRPFFFSQRLWEAGFA